jgi:hypothetical protein
MNKKEKKKRKQGDMNLITVLPFVVISRQCLFKSFVAEIKP